MKRPVGRPRTRKDGQTLTVYVPNETKARLSKFAFDDDTSISNFITTLVNEKYLQRQVCNAEVTK